MNSTSRLPWISKKQATIALAGLLAVGLVTSTTAKPQTAPTAAAKVVEEAVHHGHDHANRSGSTSSYDDESDWWCDDEEYGWYDDPSYDDECGYDDGSYDDGSYDGGSYDDGSYDDGSYDDGSYDDGSADGTTSSSSSSDSTLVATFPVAGNRLVTSGASPSAVRAANAIWNRFVALIPAERRTMLTSFELRNRNGNGAYVYIKSDHTWALGVQDGIDNPNELDAILIHEFGHLLTLNSGQLQVNAKAKACATAYFWEGCAKPDSLTARYMAQFWPLAWRDLAEAGKSDLSKRYPEWFVSNYAGTNPAEDMAETFTYFVLEAKPTKNRVLDQKINLFWSVPDMVRLRSEILASMV